MILLELISNKEKFLSRIEREWMETKDTFPDFLSNIDNKKKSLNEGYIRSISADLQKQIKCFRRIPVFRKKWHKETLLMIYDILYKEEILGINQYMSKEDIDIFFGELMDFLRHARDFAPELNFADIGQAIRNYIVYTAFKKLNRDTSGFNLAGFGYSMLYPFTDNYIDNKSLSDEDKKEYNQIIRDKIQGNMVLPKSIHQRKTCELLQDIEDLYPRDLSSTVYDLLLIMLEAQETSLRQQKRDLPLPSKERLSISIYKGGISVLMDRFFVHKEITEDDLHFYLSFGYFLQLADDLQDIKEDSRLGHSTLFTTSIQSQQEELVVNKLLHYVHDIMDTYHADNDNFKHFLLINSYLLIFSSVIRSKEFFSQDYLTAIERYFPVSISYFNDLQDHNIENMDLKYQNKYKKIMDELIRQDN